MFWKHNELAEVESGQKLMIRLRVAFLKIQTSPSTKFNAGFNDP